MSAIKERIDIFIYGLDEENADKLAKDILKQEFPINGKITFVKSAWNNFPYNQMIETSDAK